MKFTIFQDWSANHANPKGRIVLALFRIAHAFSSLPSTWRWLGYPYSIFYRVSVEWILGVEIPWKLSLGANTRLFHGQGLVINDKAVIGSNCILRHNTTIGMARTDLSFGGDAPVIGNHVDIGAGAIILGGIRVGDHVCIAAGSVVVSDVPSGATVAGNPARIIRENRYSETGND